MLCIAWSILASFYIVMIEIDEDVAIVSIYHFCSLGRKDRTTQARSLSSQRSGSETFRDLLQTLVLM